MRVESEGRVFKRPGSRFWWVAYYKAPGREVRESTRTTDEKRAKKFLTSRLKEVAAAQRGGLPFVGPAQRRITVKELLGELDADYRIRGVNSPQVQSRIKSVAEYFGTLRACTVTEHDVDRYIEAKRAAGMADATINRGLQLLGQAFTLGVRRKVLATAPAIRRLREDNVRQGFFEKDEVEAVIQNLPDYLQDFTRFAFLSSWRKGEIASLLWSDVDLDGRVIRLRGENSKNGTGRLLALEGELWSILERRRGARAVQLKTGETRLSEYVFHCRGEQIQEFRKSWRTATVKANVPGKRFHDLRRSGIRNMVRAGVPERVAMAVSGHKTRAVFDRYNIVNEADIRQAVQRTEEYLAGVSSKPANVTPFPERAAGG
jgi:integrase